MEYARTILAQAWTGTAPPAPEPGAAAQTILGLSVAAFWLLLIIVALVLILFLPRLVSRGR
jgi:hypothetical protein